MSLRDLFSSARLNEPLGRREYITAGLSLMALKYAVDATAIYLVTGLQWTPWDYFVPLLSLVGEKVAQFPSSLNLALLVWTAPFVWIGVTLSVRRAYSASISPWWVVSFFLPVVNYLFMAVLAMWPERVGARPATVPVRATPSMSRRASRLAGTAAGAVTGLSLIAFGVMTLGSYGLSIFITTPFVMGAVAGFVTCRLHPHTTGSSVAAGIAAGALLPLLLIGGALEGVVCLVMAAPLAIPIIVLGAVVGHRLAQPASGATSGIALILLLMPAGPVLDRSFDNPGERVVLSTVEIEAPPERVWSSVIAFDDIHEQPAWYFRLGLAYPVRARIDGQGPGAMRYCEFTTGAFQEPITAWEAPARLAFDVTAEPPPLKEWSPYSQVFAPHQRNYFRTSRGEFRLVALPGGRTRLEGRTWYSLRIYPTAYWTAISDVIIHEIHGRVLRHIKRRAENAP